MNNLKRTDSILPEIARDILLWLPHRKRWAQAFRRQNDMFYVVAEDGAYFLQEDGHTFWMEMPPSPEGCE